MEKGRPKGSKPQADMRATTVRLPKDLIKAAKIYALEHETTLTDLIVEGLKARIWTGPKPRPATKREGG